MKNPPRIRWENFLFIAIALACEVFLLYLFIERASLIKVPVIHFLSHYGFFIGIAIVIPGSVFLLCDFLVSVKNYKNSISEKKNHKEETELKKTLREFELEEWRMECKKNKLL